MNANEMIPSHAALLRKRFWWPLVLLLAAITYFYDLDGINIPKIGDEGVYIHIVRLTSASGHWLPLKAPPKMENTKPPLLFWQGLATSERGTKWTLFRLRFPSVLYTFLTAGLVFLLARRLAGDSEPGFLAALSFLCFFSTFQYGRPFLTNMPETFFVFLPFSLLLFRERSPDGLRLPFWFLAGGVFGFAFLYKSFVLVVPVGLALGWICLAARRWCLREFLRGDAPGITLALLTGLACFALWPLLDPDPQAVWDHFVLGENFGKLAKGNYFASLFTGNYTVFRIWLGSFANAGFLALPLLALLVIAVKRRAQLPAGEKALWIFVFSFILFYTIPAQRQENYLLPTVPALAVLLGLAWKSFSRKLFYGFALPPLLGVAGFAVGICAIYFRFAPTGLHWGQLAVVGFALALSLVTLFWNRVAPYTFHCMVILLFLSLSCVLAPSHGPLGKYPDKTIAALQGQTVYIPSHFRSSFERHRFLLPGIEVEGYDPRRKHEAQRLLDAGAFVAVNRPFGQPAESPYETLGSRLTVQSRLTTPEIKELLLHNRLDLLIQQEIILHRPSEPKAALPSLAPTAQ